MTAPQLVAFVEGKLKEVCAHDKVVPSEAVLPALTEESARLQVSSWVDEVLKEMLSVDAIKEKVAAKLLEEIGADQARRWIAEGFERGRALSWRTVLGDKLGNLLREEHADVLNELVRESISEAVVDE
jgi:hypothetical protein